MFATYPLLAGIEKANMIFNIVFFISVTSVLIQGTTLPVVAKWLRVSLPVKAKPVSELDKLILDLPKSLLQEIEILPDFSAVNKRIVELNFPQSAFIVMIKRNGEYILPRGSTLINENDVLMILTDSQEDFAIVRDCLFKSSHMSKK